jgi:hypothetical protein
MERDRTYQLFVKYHYTIEVVQSYRPSFSSRGMNFPHITIVKKNRLTLIEKLRYYIEDFKLFIRGIP